MKKYKFKIGQEVYLWGSSYANEMWVRIVKRKTENGQNYYRVSNFNHRTSEFIHEDIIHGLPREQEEVCSKNGCELVEEMLEQNIDVYTGSDEDIEKEIKELDKLIIEKNIEIEVVNSIFKEAVEKLKHEQNSYIYRKACLLNDEATIKETLLDAIID